MKWVAHDPSDPASLPARQGVYVFVCDGRVLYVGQTANLRTRIAAYRVRPTYSVGFLTPWGQFDTCVLKYSHGRRYGDWAMRELRLIRRLTPPGNCVGSSRERRRRRPNGSPKLRQWNTDDYVNTVYAERGVR